MKERIAIILLSLCLAAHGSTVFIDSYKFAASFESGTNVEKLSGAWSVGTEFHVSDGFVVIGFGDSRDGFYTFNTGPSAWIKSSDASIANSGAAFGFKWNIAASATWQYGTDNDSYSQGSADATSVGDAPWEVDWTVASLTLTHPAVQTLAAPSTAQGGVAVLGGTQDGVYYDTQRTWNSRPTYKLLGVPVDVGTNAGDDASVLWQSTRWTIYSGANSGSGDPLYYSLSAVVTPDLAGTDKFVMAVSGVAYSQRGTFNGRAYYNKIGSTTSTALDAIFWSSATWHISNALGVDLDTSTSAVVTPDLATFLLATVVTNTAWLNAADDTPAAITVSSMTQGLIDAGFVMTGSDVSATNDTYVGSGNSNGRTSYLGLVNAKVEAWDGSNWKTSSGNPASSTNAATPISATFNHSAVITRDDVASEANWTTP